MQIKEKVLKAINNWGVYIICFILLFFMLYLCIASMIFTTDMNMNNSMLENIEYKYDNFLLNISALILGLVLVFILYKFLPPIKPWIIYSVLFAFICAFGVLFILSSQSAPTHDSLIVTRAAYYASQGDFSRLDANYFNHFPFQLGYVLYSEILIKFLCPYENYIALEIINVILLAASYVVIAETTKVLFGDRVMTITSILFAVCLPPIFFCSFLYGNIPGFFFAMLAVMFTVKFLKSDKWYYGLLSALSISFSVAIKLNYTIIFVAILITVLFHFITKKKLIKIVYILMSFAILLGIKQLPVIIYEQRSGVEFGEGVPMLSWAAMGMNESFIAPGWFNANYTTVNYDHNNKDSKAATESSIEEIKTRLKLFAEDKAYRNDFFAKKALSQFNEPSYQSIWTNQVRGHYSDMGKIAEYVCVDGESNVKQYMNFHQQLIFFGMFFGLCSLVRKKDILMCIFPLSVLGGIIYHMIFEAKSQYFIVYFILMIPVAAYGIQFLYEKFVSVIKNKKVSF